MDDDELNLGGLRDYACTAMEQVGLAVEPLEQPVPGAAFELAGRPGRLLCDGIVHGGQPSRTVRFIVATGDGVGLTAREALLENATSGLGWSLDRHGQWGLSDGIAVDPLEPANLQIRKQEAERLLSPRLGDPEADSLVILDPGPEIGRAYALMDGVGVPGLERIDGGLRFSTPVGPAELRYVEVPAGPGEPGSPVAAVVWVEVGQLEDPRRAGWLLSQRHRMREGAIAMLPGDRVVIRGWRFGELENFNQLARLLSTLLTTAQELRAEL